MSDASSDAIEQLGHEAHVTERSSHAIYGLIIITASLVADRVVAEDARTSLMVLWGTAAVLVLAHVYAAAVAEAGEKGRWLDHTERHLLIADNLPVLAAVLMPTVLLLGAELGVISLAVALDLSIIVSVAALFVVGVYQARRQHATLAVQIGLGALGGFIGVLVITLEVWLAH